MILWRIIRNKYGFTDEEIDALKKTQYGQKVPHVFSYPYWIKVEMVKTNRCSAGWKQGDTLYFRNGGMLISRKAPPIVCSHALAVLSPVFYACIDRQIRGGNPEDVVIDHVSCTDPGFDHGGTGNNTMRITYERMPFYQRLRDTLTAVPYFFYWSSKARGPRPGGLPKTADSNGRQGMSAVSLNHNRPCQQSRRTQRKGVEKIPLSDAEVDVFIQSEKRMKRIAGIERWKQARIVVEIVKADACIAGHGVGEKIYFDAMGRLLTESTDKPVCSRLVNKIWYRLIMVLDRIADVHSGSLGDGKFSGAVPGVPMSCYSAEFPFGDCGYVLMGVSMEEMNNLPAQ